MKRLRPEEIEHMKTRCGTFEEFLGKWVARDPENTGCYTRQDIEYLYEQHLAEYL